MRIVYAADQWSATRDKLLERRDLESCAIGLARSSHGRLIIHDVRHPGPADYLARSPLSAQLTPEFIFETANRARTSGSWSRGPQRVDCPLVTRASL